MSHIIHDPNTDECPAYGGVEFEAIREMIIAGHRGQITLTNEEAVEKLKTAWQRAQERKVDLWNEQVLQDQTAREEEERAEQELAIQRRQEKAKEEEDAQREAERKKTTLTWTWSYQVTSPHARLAMPSTRSRISNMWSLTTS
jgi:hypothetical protein